jgi:hypothetical protein
MNAKIWTALGEESSITANQMSHIFGIADKIPGCIRVELFGEIYRNLQGEWVCLGVKKDAQKKEFELDV